MTITLTLVVVLILASFIMMVVDSCLGMLYGTILSPVLIGVGFEPLLVVPAILLSQTIGDLSATPCHHKFGNANFGSLTKDVKVVLAMVLPGLIAVMIGALIAVGLPSAVVKTYVGALVIVMGLLVLIRRRFKYRFKFHIIYGTIASFNKVISGGGFGPITSTGGIIGGLKSRVSVATTSFAELIICVGSFIAYLILRGMIDPYFAGALCIGAFAGGIVGPYLASRTNQDKLRVIVAIFGLATGVWLLAQVILG